MFFCLMHGRGIKNGYSEVTQSMHTFELKGLCVRKEAKDILQDINLLVRRGDKILIQGPSGSGKSTLLRAVLGFEKCSQGTVVYDGIRVSSSTIRDFRSQCTYIGQSPLSYEGTVLEYVHLPFGFKVNRGRCPGEEDILAILQKLGFAPEILTAEYRSLSGGEQQRVTIAQALLLKRDLYLLDEVTSSLDQANIIRVINLFTGSADRTVIAVSHNHEWRGEGMRVFALQNGHLQEEGERA